MLFAYLLRGFVHLLRLSLGSLTVTGQENIPESGPYIVVTNHMSKADPPVLLLAFPPMRLRFFAGEKWESHPIYGTIMKEMGAIYINRGEVDRKALREALQALENGSIFGLAPEGTRSRLRELIPAKDGAAYLATRAQVPVVPVGVVNTDIIGDNARRLRRTAMEAHIGKPFTIPAGKRAKGAELEAATHLIMAHIASLLPARYHGVYAESPVLAALQRGDDPWPEALAAAGIEPAVESA